jgi:hypothetical protein
MGQPKFQPFFSCTKRDLQKSVDIVRQRRPDLIHIHGTERYYGLLAARKLTPAPCVISLQGFLGACVKGFFGDLSPRDVWRSERLIELGPGAVCFGAIETSKPDPGGSGRSCKASKR